TDRTRHPLCGHRSSRAAWAHRADDERAGSAGVSSDRSGDASVNEPLSQLGRFAEPSLYILVSLGGGPRRGYAIMTDVEEMTGSPLGPGTLYGALARLERRGPIAAVWAEAPPPP